MNWNDTKVLLEAVCNTGITELGEETADHFDRLLLLKETKCLRCLIGIRRLIKDEVFPFFTI